MLRPSSAVALLATSAFALASRAFPQAPVSAAPAALDAYDVVWRTPSRDASGSMPIGNGEVGCNVWCEPDGRLCFYVARTDSFSEASRLLKLGKVTVQVRSPVDGEFFEQRLCLREGCIRITWGEGERRVALELFVDAETDVVHVTGEFARDERVSVSAETWRTRERRLEGEELRSSWSMHSAPEDVVVEESADHGVGPGDGPFGPLGFYHRNESSVVAFTLARQGLVEPGAPAPADPLLHRTFGLLLGGPGLQRGHIRDLLHPVLVSSSGRTFALQVAAPCVQDADEHAWNQRASRLLAADPITAAARTTAWWNAFWQRSWIFVQGDTPVKASAAPADPPPPSRITQALVLQRWIQACGGRGRYPIKFNGSIFTVEPGFTGGQTFDADWRKWGDCFWWQNTRLSYYPMLAQGDFDMTAPLFRLYLDTLPLAQERVRAWYDGKAQGAWWPETMTPFGTHGNGDYGWQREGLPASKVLCPWWEYTRNQGLELLALMLERWDYERDPAFLAEQVLPLAGPVLAWFASAYPRDEQGKLRITPTQALETYWHGVQDDLPTVAGLHWVLARLLELPPERRTVEAAASWRKLQTELPPIPLREEDGVKLLAPAGAFAPERSNCESPELYAIFPFRHFGLGKPDLAVARTAYARRHDRFTDGWPQDGQDAALLGLVAEAQQNLLAKVQNHNRAHRFPAMWGPNFDWCPDQTHGGNLLDMTQRMLLQCDGDRIRVLPCWPKEWDVTFRLHAPQRTTVAVTWRAGKLEKLAVTPEARAKDVVVGPD